MPATRIRREFRMELAAEEPRVPGQLDHLAEIACGFAVRAGADRETRRLDPRHSLEGARKSARIDCNDSAACQHGAGPNRVVELRAGEQLQAGDLVRLAIKTMLLSRRLRSIAATRA